MRKIPTEFQLRPDQINAIDDETDNRSQFVRDLLDDELGLEGEA
ncbi:hypothetical protein [Natronomonas sp. CBA1123]|jgi:hypothetical protein|nr:hypothetical protein [Natronomonas sp. CBA1123]